MSSKDCEEGKDSVTERGEDCAGGPEEEEEGEEGALLYSRL